MLYADGESAGQPEGVVSDAKEASYGVQAEETIPAESWSHLALTSDGEDLRIYVNGKLSATAPAADAQQTDGELSIGAESKLNQYFSGAIDEVLIYDRQLSAEEIVRDRDAAYGGPELELGGPLLEGSPGVVVSPDLPLTVKVSDRGSKLAAIELLVDGEPERSIPRDEMLADGATQSCEGATCHFTYTFTAAAANDIAGGVHSIGIVAVDENGQRTTRAQTVNFDVEPPEVRLGGDLLRATDGGILEEEEANLEVEAADWHDGDTGISEIRVAVDGEIALAEHFSCEPTCEEEGTAEFVYKTAEWGEGPHRVDVTAFDAAGNESTEFLLVDATPLSVAPECSEAEPSSVEGAGVVTAAEARERLEEVVPGAIEENLPEEETPELFLYPFWASGQPETPAAANFYAREAFTSGTLAKEPGGAFTIGSAACLVPTTTTSAETSAVRPSNMRATVIRANTSPETDTAIRVTSLGGAIVESFRGEEAPAALSWRAALSEGEEFQELEDGSVALVKPAGVDIEPTEIPTFPSGARDPETLDNTRLQAEASMSEVASANSEVEGRVMAVLAPPVFVDSEGNLSEGELTASGDVITAVRPEGSVALVIRASTAPNPVTMCARAAPSYPTAFTEVCGPEEAGDRGFIPSFDWLGDSIVYAMETFSSSGSEGDLASSRIYTANADGSDPVAITPPDYLYFDPQASADGSKIVATRCDLDETHCGIHVMDADGSDDELVTEDATTERDYHPTFGPTDGEIYFFRSMPTGAHEAAVERQLFYVDVSGANEREITDVLSSESCPDEPPCNLGLGEAASPPSVSPDGEDVVFTFDGQIWKVETGAEEAGLEELVPLTEVEGEQDTGWPAYSPDGEKILYYYSAEPTGSEADGIYEMEPSGSGKTLLVPYVAGTGEARFAVYDPDEEEVAYLHQGLLYGVGADGEGTHLISEGGGEPVSLIRSVVNNGGPLSLKAAEEGELVLADFKVTIPNPFGPDPEGNEGELVFCLTDLVRAAECDLYFEDRGTATEKRGDLFTARYQEDRSTRGNAFQHAFWTALMVRHSYNPNEDWPDGVIFALLHEGDPPYSWDSRMDVLNDFVGRRFDLFHAPVEDWKICEGLRIKSRRAIYMGKNNEPDQWANNHHFDYEHPVFRFLRSANNQGPVVRLNGRVCEPGSPT